LSKIDEEHGMPAKRELTMRQLRHMLRLAYEGVSAREIGRRLGVARSTIQDNLKRAAAAGLNWPLPEDLSDNALEKRLFAHAGVKAGERRRVEPCPASAPLRQTGRVEERRIFGSS
jgi:IS30 family transposase